MRTATSESVTTKRAIGYFRVSTNRQAGERHVSLETQKERFSSYCQIQEYIAVMSFTDVETGRKDNRKEYQEMLHFLQDGGADVVIVQYLDRFGRNPKEILRRIWSLQEIGVEVVATDEDIQEELILLIRAGIAGAESRKTAARVKANMARAVSRGVHAARAPYGFEGIRQICNDGQARVSEFVHRPVEVAAIREMYRLALEENLGQKRMADRLNALGYRTRNGKYFEPSTLLRIMTNEALKGTLAYGKTPRKNNEQNDIIRIEGFFPAILTAEEWSLLQDRLNLRRNVNAQGRTFVSQYLLSSLLRCGHCGGPMVGKTMHNQKYVYRRYYCSRALKARAKCGYYNGHNAQKLEAKVLETLEGYADRNQALAILSQLAERTSDHREAELREVEAAIRACEMDFETHLKLFKAGHISEAQFAAANHPVKQRYDNLLPRRNELRNAVLLEVKREAWQENLADMLTTFTEDFRSLPIAQQKARLMEIIEEIRITNDKTIEIRFRELPLGS